MKISLEYELFSFFASVVLALIIGVIYDFFRALQNRVKKAAILDVIMWICMSCLVVWAWFFVFSGKLRWYIFLGVFFSDIIYFLTLSKCVYFLVDFFVDKICRIFGVIFKILLTPPRFLCKIIGVYIGWLKSKFSKKVEGKYDEKNTEKNAENQNAENQIER